PVSLYVIGQRHLVVLAVTVGEPGPAAKDVLHHAVQERLRRGLVRGERHALFRGQRVALAVILLRPLFDADGPRGALLDLAAPGIDVTDDPRFNEVSHGATLRDRACCG